MTLASLLLGICGMSVLELPRPFVVGPGLKLRMVSQRNFGMRDNDADGADEQVVSIRLMPEDMPGKGMDH
ncbi:hypothetical protein [Croceicoccus hydrothermalis]|uniref:hypothetical protein n=1 Tax=Croceicoccus hydrothermalis TaxID=2867964 RepID=UPI001EFB2345|nr:hypothetical protein [Croceicoccus hydrothermalis]